MKIRPVILCGGAGTRLWPSSKKNLPKQFVDWGGWTLFGKTLERIKNPIFDYPIITTNYSYLNLVRKFLSKYKFKKYKIILEPFKKNTAPAILTSALIKEVPYSQPMIFFSSELLIFGNAKLIFLLIIVFDLNKGPIAIPIFSPNVDAFFRPIILKIAKSDIITKNSIKYFIYFM